MTCIGNKTAYSEGGGDQLQTVPSFIKINKNSIVKNWLQDELTKYEDK